MPHSSGGGSHGGGSHGGSHGGGSHGSSGPRISRNYFHGARRYVYYRHNEPRYFYADKNFKPGFHPLRLLILLIYLPFVIGLLPSLKSAFRVLPKNYDHTIIIKDEGNVINNESELDATLHRFMEKTGVAPSVITVKNYQWQKESSSLQSYAYDRYLSEFNDEMHWLIVYSQPDKPDPAFNDWYWEGMQGDDTDPVLTEDVTAEFNSRFHNALLQDDTDIGAALNKAFSEFTDNYKKPSIFRSIPFPVLFAVLFLILHASVMVGLPDLKYRNAVPAPTDSEKDMQYGGGYMQPKTDNYTVPPASQKPAYPGMESSRPQGTMTDLYGSVPQSYGSNTSSARTVCQYCGTTFASKYKRCPNCNADNPDKL
ncbi:zinc ribbon domain-containing protein [Ruminococcus flavefaciens]|uniref:zinc ribbon domain-containing protein n=1 Tax=Ruminococcus flavefaciens TaxID=1265 RepID=UPI0002D59831|nr:zinc ribbon domain-containing protein [Ruminococcus flavefaciens]